MARRTDAKFNEIVLRRLFMSKINRPPISLARLARNMRKEGREGKIAVIIGTVTNDLRIFKVPKLQASSSLKQKNFENVMLGRKMMIKVQTGGLTFVDVNTAC